MNIATPAPEVTEAAAELSSTVVRAFRTFKQLRPSLPTPVHGLDQGALPLLFVLDDGERRVSSLAEACHADLSTTSRYATSLARLGLVEKTPDEHDRRAQVLVITDAGREVVSAARSTRGHLFGEILADWEVDDIRRLDAYLHRLASDVERHQKSGALAHDSTKED